jgi:Na+/H+ antiporter NhaC
MKNYIKISMQVGKVMTLLLVLLMFKTGNPFPLVMHLLFGAVAAQMVFHRKDFNAQRDTGFAVRCAISGLPAFIAVLAAGLFPKEIKKST